MPTVDGETLPYVELDNAATTPPLRPVLDAVEQLLPFNASVHRGTGYKSQYSTRRYEEARASVGRFVGADERQSVVLFTKNTTEAINRLARLTRRGPSRRAAASTAWATGRAGGDGSLQCDREAGTPNVVGAVALEAAARWLATSGLQSIAAHERELARYATRLAAVPGLTLYGPRTGDRVGVLPFTVDGLDHAFVAAVLGFEHGIGVRNGCFCAHPYVGHLLGLGRAASSALLARVAAGDRREVPGLVRVSLGCHNRAADIDRLVDALDALVAGWIRASYRQLADGSFTPVSGVDVPTTGEKRHHGGLDRR